MLMHCITLQTIYKIKAISETKILLERIISGGNDSVVGVKL